MTMAGDPLLAVYTTVGSADAARAMARGLVERHLAACVQITPIESFYRWDGVVQHDNEFRLMCKTTQGRYAAVAAAIRELHAYELPAIHAVPVSHAEGDYAAWVVRETGTDPAG